MTEQQPDPSGGRPRRRGSPVRKPPHLAPRYERTETEFDDWVAAVTERADPFMAWLGVVFALLVGYELAVELTPPAAVAVEVVGWTIWSLFALELAAKLWLAPDRWRFLRRHWWQPVLLLVPALRVFRFVRLLRLGRAFPASRVVSSSYRAAGTARYLLRSRLAYLGGLTAVVIIAAAELAYLFERDRADGVFGSFGDAVVWSIAAVVAMQADPVPASAGGQIVMLVAFVAGLLVVASLAGVAGGYLVEERRERAAAEPGSEGPGA